MSTVRCLAVLLLFCCAGLAAGAADQSPVVKTEEQKIEGLLAFVAVQKDIRFVRNGSDYDAAMAVKFLRAKWDRQRAEIKTVDDFIDKAATKSSTSGQPYLIRLKDRTEVPCADFLRKQLAEGGAR
ncbi:MAG: hypothetical protein JWQ62_2056 [Lacunisphaera sp.]|nr:hypothetical protein [Lacunisphaera sp.]